MPLMIACPEPFALPNARTGAKHTQAVQDVRSMGRCMAQSASARRMPRNEGLLCLRLLVLFVFLLTCHLFSAGAHAQQCDSVPPRLTPAVTMAGGGANDRFGQFCYLLHDSVGKALTAISIGPGGNTVRLYSQLGNLPDTSFQCCLRYVDARECHVTSTGFTDYVVRVQGGGDSVFFIPGSPEGIWSKNKVLLLAAASDAQIVTGRFRGAARDMIVIGMRELGSPSYSGQLLVWDGRRPIESAPDTILQGGGSDSASMLLGSSIGAADLDHDGIPDLVVMSGGWQRADGSSDHIMNIFWGGPDFPHVRTQWRDRALSGGWYWTISWLAAVDHNGIDELLVPMIMESDTVWGLARSGGRIAVYHGVRRRSDFDTSRLDIWRPPLAPDRTCVVGTEQFATSFGLIPNIRGDESPAYAIGTDPLHDGSGPVLFYLGGTVFDTIPDSYWAGARGAFGGIDWNNDSIGDIVIPRPDEPGPNGTHDQPAGVVQIVSGSRTWRSFGVDAVKEPQVPGVTELQVFPQPAHERVTLSIVGAIGGELRDVRITDILGREVRYTPVQGSTQTVSLEGYPTGSYNLHGQQGSRVFSRWFVHIR